MVAAGTRQTRASETVGTPSARGPHNGTARGGDHLAGLNLLLDVQRLAAYHSGASDTTSAMLPTRHGGQIIVDLVVQDVMLAGSVRDETEGASC